MELINQLPQYGVAGLVSAIALIIVGMCAREIRHQYNTRLTDWKAVAEIMQLNQATLKELIAASESRSRAQEAMARAQEAAVHVQTSLADEVRRSSGAIQEQQKELRNLQMELQKLREQFFQYPRRERE